MTEDVYVAVFAHNEAENIARCVRSIRYASSEVGPVQIHILNNGSRDQTSSVVRSLQKSDDHLFLHEIELGDKSNAWNHYVHSECASSGVHVFMDGDTWLPAGSLDFIVDAFDANRFAAAAPIPIGVSESHRDQLITNQWLAGNLYVLSPTFVRLVRNKGFKLPIGFIGDDSAVGYLVETGCLGAEKGQMGVQVIEETGPVIPRLPFTKNTAWLMHRRYQRYALRHFQQEIFYEMARQHRLDDLPEHASQLAGHMKLLGMRASDLFEWCGVMSFYLPMAYRHFLRGMT